MSKWKCEKHGVLDPNNRIHWARIREDKRWCLLCMNEFMDKNFTRLIEVEDKEAEK